MKFAEGRFRPVRPMPGRLFALLLGIMNFGELRARQFLGLTVKRLVLFRRWLDIVVVD